MTARRRTPAQVLYGGADDRVLRLALLEEWGWRCYWRGEPLSVSIAQIDHIIPQTVTPARLAELIVRHHLAADFDLHAPANLAPICAACNNDKRDGDYLEAPAVHTKLVTARRHAPAVVRRVEALKTAVATGRALIAAATADLTQPKAHAEFLEFAPAVVQTLALLDEDRADFVVRRDVVLYLSNGTIPASFTLNARGRARYAWVEEICSRAWSELIEDGMRKIVTHAQASLEPAIRDECGETASILSSSTDSLTATMDIADVRRDGSLMTCQVSGQLEAHYSALVHDAGPDFEISYIDVEADVVTRFLLTVSWDLTAALTELPATNVVITGTDADVGGDRLWK
ncbi:HNH endonuclease signature motif containing protein [Dactylosporangium sp. NPDC050688]|uniref:HNH endonuclease n=1 Tax=Dactylosporangium sp. NPDC050688 TaxID=3157217 RepID=UPI00340F2C28